MYMYSRVSTVHSYQPQSRYFANFLYHYYYQNTERVVRFKLLVLTKAASTTAGAVPVDIRINLISESI